MKTKKTTRARAKARKTKTTAKRSSRPRAKLARGRKTTRRKKPTAAKAAARKKATAPKRPAARRRAAAAQMAATRKKTSRKKPAQKRRKRAPEQPPENPGFAINTPLAGRGLGPEAGGQSGDTEGLSRVELADSESVEELVEEGQAFEAGIVGGVENAPDADQGGVRTRQVPEDDVPREYLDED